MFRPAVVSKVAVPAIAPLTRLIDTCGVIEICADVAVNEPPPVATVNGFPLMGLPVPIVSVPVPTSAESATSVMAPPTVLGVGDDELTFPLILRLRLATRVM